MFPAGAGAGGAGVAASEEEIYELTTSHSWRVGFLPSRYSDINISQLREVQLLQAGSQS